MSELFRRFAVDASQVLGSVWALLITCLLVLAWLLTGPYFGYSDTWQLVANTTISVVTLLMVFVIQSSQNRAAAAANIKLDELLRAVEGARTGLINVDVLSEQELMRLEKELARIGRRVGLKPLTETNSP